MQTVKIKLPEDSYAHSQIIGGSVIYKAINKTFAIMGEKTLCPSRVSEAPKESVALGGSPITKEIAIELINVVFGVATWKSTWLNSGFCFRDPERPLSFGLLTYKNEVKGLMMCVQAYFLKHLLFHHQDNQTTFTSVEKLLQPSVEDRNEVLLIAIIDILFKVGGESNRIVVCLPQQNSYYEQSSELCTDGVTEKLHIFEFHNMEDAQKFFKKYFSIFLENPGCGCILFLYSLVLTRTFSRLRNELGKKQDQLLTNYGFCSQALVNLILTGIATPYTHNGIVYESEDIDGQSLRKVGAMDRSEIGLLIWQQSDQCGSMIGSRLKTPRFPIWVTRIGSQYGVLFNPNRELTSDYRAENHFQLHYYSSSRGQRDPIVLNIDTRSDRRRDERDVPLLERLISTKWHDATVSWNGSTPFF
ncbi:hypothetical protein CHUAL_002058 [Chamberlinius hualienensis]